ncbi:hypothetical protein EJ05DRAFT_509685 [Pseudovirgaria hyperparasitica]|uniref:Deoxycytidylate deaminase n=1 Tax=Pseudovirgaria hyperparasitica TaxID=470096 RepID=A0A6A6WDH6_9PEZI|nr:uncharacterized protein EJ05DRAFT_509685 [Pseudovirgaria hyperparasitica]KAF2760020.1 hypothetical protein EJ05DRAFT_509685 [Pseudovirgaria hyperparasitica]
MFIGICGGICAGKDTIAKYLVREHGFTRLYLSRNAPTPPVERSASDAHVPAPDETTSSKSKFHTADDLLAHVTASWQQRWVTTDIWDESVLDVYDRRPAFILLSVDAPITTRWERFRVRCERHSLTPPDLTEFVLRNDVHIYSHEAGLAYLLNRASIRLLNTSTSLEALYSSLDDLDLTNEERLRPSWDVYFMQLSDLAAQRSNCMKRRVGAVLVGKERRVISTGYNGTPRGMKNCNHGGCPRCNTAARAGAGLDTCLCLHAEENALLEAGRERIRDGSILYCNTCPCLTCSVKIAQVGISEVIYSQQYSLDRSAERILGEAGVKLRQFSPPKEGLVDLAVATKSKAQTNGHVDQLEKFTL